MSGGTVAILLAAFFTFGCITIQESRQHAGAMTLPLTFVAVCLGLFVALVAMAERPGAIDRTTAIRATMGQPR